MLKYFHFIAISFFLLLQPGHIQAEVKEQENLSGVSLMEAGFLNLSEYQSLELKDNFFRRLFGSRKKTPAERMSRSQRHSTSRPQRYTPPPSNSQAPESHNGRRRSLPQSDLSAIRNEPKDPLHTSLRDQELSTGRWELGLSLGTAHSITDLAGNKGLSFGEFTDYHSSNFGLNMGVFTRYIMNHWFALSLGMDFMTLSAERPFAQDTPANNAFRFTNDVFEFYAKTEFMLPALSRSPFDMYAFAGIGVFFSDARVFDRDGRIVDPQVDYSQVQPVLPLGFGFSYTLPNSLKLGYEFGWRNTIFNYLDGVSLNNERYDNYFLNRIKISYGF